jgi:hypothetical protein
MQEILVDRGQFVCQHRVQVLDNLLFAFHGLSGRKCAKPPPL